MQRLVIIGAQRSGTSYLARALDEHPDVCMAKPMRPEPKFFLRDEDFARGLTWYDNTYFSNCSQSQVLGEKSVGYLNSPVAAGRMEQLIPDARLIAILRDPVERAISHYRFSVENGLETRPIDEALLADEDDGVDRRDGAFWVGRRSVASHPHAYRSRGNYAYDLDAFGYWVRAGRMMVLQFETTVGSPAMLASVFRFLGIHPSLLPTAVDSVVNPTAAETRPTPSVVAELAAFFKAASQRLTDEWGFDLNLWTS